MSNNSTISTEFGRLSAHFRVGFLGAGQLAKMSALKALELGLQIAGYSDRPDSEPMHHLCPNMFYGSFEDVEAMINFAKTCDVITLENEFIDSSILQKVQQESGTPIYPSPESFAKIENKFIEFYYSVFSRMGNYWNVVNLYTINKVRYKQLKIFFEI